MRNGALTQGMWLGVSVGGWSTCARRSDGGYCWGHNFGEIGDGTRIDRDQPAAVLDVASFDVVAAGLAVGGSVSCGVDAAGIAWCWGRERDGALGDGGELLSVTERPVRVAPSAR